jgi:hypothetical protein
VLSKRLEVCLPEVTVEPRAKLWLLTLSDRPGQVVMLAAVVAHLATMVGKNVTLNTLIERAFPMHVPSEEVYKAMWDKQKDKDGNNLLDVASSWKEEEVVNEG